MGVQDGNVGYTGAVDRLRNAGIVGASGRLRDLFDFLIERGPDGEPATQTDIAKAVFQQEDSEGDDATVRVYVHRLRKKIDDHYAAKPVAVGETQLEIPAGIYALQICASQLQSDPKPEGVGRRTLVILGCAALAVIAAFVAGWGLSNRGPSVNAIWDPVIASERPVLLVLGDYYMFGEIDPVRPDEGRLIRDFRVNSAEDLLRLQEAEPERYGSAEDFAINYLPFSAAYGLSDVAPLLVGNGKQVSVIAASALEPDMLNFFDVVYIGLFSGLDLLEDQTFTGSGFRLGESYDELVDRQTGQRWISEEARSLASPAFYRDYAFVSRFIAPSGAIVTVVASERDTGLRGLSPIIAGTALPEDLEAVADGSDPFEALVQVTGQQGADLNHRLILARVRE